MPHEVKTRSYRSALRAEQAARTRRAVLRAAHRCFTTAGYRQTTVARIAAEAGVAVDTVYASVGRKPELVLALVDEALAGHDPARPGGEPTPSVERDYVRAVRAATTAGEKLATYAAAVAHRAPAVVPLIAVLRQAAGADEAAGRVLHTFDERRAANMRLLAAELRATGELRDDLDDDAVADLLWATNAPEFTGLLQSRGKEPDAVERVLLDLWTRVLLA